MIRSCLIVSFAALCAVRCHAAVIEDFAQQLMRRDESETDAGRRAMLERLGDSRLIVAVGKNITGPYTFEITSLSGALTLAPEYRVLVQLDRTRKLEHEYTLFMTVVVFPADGNTEAMIDARVVMRIAGPFYTVDQTGEATASDYVEHLAFNRADPGVDDTP